LFPDAAYPQPERKNDRANPQAVTVGPNALCMLGFAAGRYARDRQLHEGTSPELGEMQSCFA